MATNIAGIASSAKAILDGAQFIFSHASEIMRYEPMITEVEKAATQFTTSGATEAIINGINLGEVEADIGVSVRQSGVPSIGVWGWLANGSVVAVQLPNGDLTVNGVTYAPVVPSAPLVPPAA